MAIPKRNKKAEIAELPETVAAGGAMLPSDNAPQIETPDVPEQIAPEETAAPKPEVVLPIMEQQQPSQETPPDNSAPIAVPHTPTEEELWGNTLYQEMNTLFLNHYKGRPFTSTWVEPTPEERKLLIRTKAVGIDPIDDPEAFAAIVNEVNNQIAKDREASGQGKQIAIDRAYLIEARRATKDLLDTIGVMIDAVKGGKSSKPASATTETGERKPRATSERTRANWADLNPKLIAWATENGLPDFVLVDQTNGGYKGIYHAVRARADGKWEKVEYENVKHTYTATGELVDKPVYFNNPDTGKRPTYSDSQMFHILMIDGKGSLVDVDGVTIGKNKKHLGDLEIVLDNLG